MNFLVVRGLDGHLTNGKVYVGQIVILKDLSGNERICAVVFGDQGHWQKYDIGHFAPAL